MQLFPPGPGRDAPDVAAALHDAASRWGQRPAITLLTPEGRQEQSFASLAQWAGKTAHWLALEQLLGPGDRLGIVGAPGWVPAAAALGAWWAGLVVVVGPDATSADVVVVGPDATSADVVVAGPDAPSGAVVRAVADRDVADPAAGTVPDVAAAGTVPEVAAAGAVPDADVLTWGHGFDGAPRSADGREPFTHAVQTFPDQPPPPAARRDAPALSDGRTAWTQGGLLDAWRGAPAVVVGIPATGDGPTPAVAGATLGAVAVRPLVTGRASVVLAAGVDRAAAAGDRVADWLAG